MNAKSQKPSSRKKSAKRNRQKSAPKSRSTKGLINKAGKLFACRLFLSAFLRRKAPKVATHFRLRFGRCYQHYLLRKQTSLHRQNYILTTGDLRSAESRGGLIVALHGFLLTIHKLLPPVSDIEQNQLICQETSRFNVFLVQTRFAVDQCER